MPDDDIKEPSAPHGESATPESEPYSELPPQVYRADQPAYTPPPAVVPPPTQALTPAEPPKAPPPPPPKPPVSEDEDDDPEERGMLRMSFMDHLEDLRRVILRAVAGVIVAFFGAFIFAKQVWAIVSAPAVNALHTLGIKPPTLAQLSPMEVFNVIYIKLPLL